MPLTPFAPVPSHNQSSQQGPETLSEQDIAELIKSGELSAQNMNDFNLSSDEKFTLIKALTGDPMNAVTPMVTMAGIGELGNLVGGPIASLLGKRQGVATPTMPGKAPNSPAGMTFPPGMGEGMPQAPKPPQSFPEGMGQGMPKVPPFGQGMPQAPQSDLDSRISGLPPGPSNGSKAAPQSDFYERLLSSLGGNQGRPAANSTSVARRTLRDAYASLNKGIGVEDQNRIMSGKGPAVDTRQGMSIEQLLAELKKVMPR